MKIYLAESKTHKKSLSLIKFLTKAADSINISEHVYIVGGAVRDFKLGLPIKDIDIVIDASNSGTGGFDSADFAQYLSRVIPAPTSLETNQYGVAILTIKNDWHMGGINLKGEVIEIANARTESYGGDGGKGYKPSDVEISDIRQDVYRREFTFNTLLWRLASLKDGVEKAEILDLTGCGLEDLESGKMRCPSDPDITFSDDPTRMLRAVKFLLRYDWDVVPEVKDSISRNAQKLLDVPQNAVHTILVENILPYGLRGLQALQRLNLLPVIADLIESDSVFKESQLNYFKSLPIKSFISFNENGYPLKVPYSNEWWAPAAFEIIKSDLVEDPDEFYSAMIQPGRAIKDKGFMPSLMSGVPNNQKYTIAKRVSDLIREQLILEPNLIGDAISLKNKVLNKI